MSYKAALIDAAMSVGALKFGTFTLKSGRTSPYFINAGLLSSGPILHTVASAYAETILSTLPKESFDVLFGPAYKGIAFAATASLVLHSLHEVSTGFAYDRKEVKDHGEGGKVVGTVKGKRVVIIDDVMTSGKAVREAIQTVRNEGGEVVGVIQLLDREEVGQDGQSSTVLEVEGIVGEGRVKSILKMSDLMNWLEDKGMTGELEGMKEYRHKYGLRVEK